MEDCYVCTLKTNKLSKCKCKNMFLHLECQLKLLNKSNDTRCSICLGEYSNITYSIVKKKSISDKGRKLLLIITLETIVITALIIELCILLNLIDNNIKNINEKEEYIILAFIQFIFIMDCLGLKAIYILMKSITINNSFFTIEMQKIIKIKSEEDINRIL